MRNFLKELRRRRVIQVVILYVVAAWGVIEVAKMVIEAYPFLFISLKDVFNAVYLGFPAAVIAGWFYDISRHGIVRTPPVDAGPSFDTSLHKGDYFLVTILVATWAGSNVLLHTPAPVERSIAVLPFENRGHDPNNAWLAYGFHDDLMTQLQKLSDIKVIAKPSTEMIDKEMSIAQKARSLDVAYVVIGSVERVLDRVRVNVTLVDARLDKQAWAGSFDRPITAVNMFDIRDEVTEEITNELQATISPEELERIQKRPTETTDAHLAYMLGRRELGRRSVSSMTVAIQHFQRAIELDPEYAAAYAGLGDSYRMRRQRGGPSYAESIVKEQAAVEQAVVLDDQSGEALISKAHMLANQGGKIDEAEHLFKRGIQLSPNYAQGYLWYGLVLNGGLGRPKEAIAMLERAVELDPLSGLFRVNLGAALGGQNRLNEAEAQFKRAIQVAPDYAEAYTALGGFYGDNYGQWDQEIRYMLQGQQKDPENMTLVCNLARAFLYIGDEETATAIYDVAMSKATKTYWCWMSLSVFAYYRGNLDQAWEFTNALEIANPQSHWVNYWRAFHSINARNFEKAVTYFEILNPKFRSAEPQEFINSSNYFWVIEYTYALRQVGRVARAEILLEHIKSVMLDMPSPDWPAYYSVAGDKDAALVALRAAMDNNKDSGWYWFTFYPLYEVLWDSQEFHTIIVDLEAEQDRQRRELVNDPEVQELVANLLETSKGATSTAELP